MKNIMVTDFENQDNILIFTDYLTTEGVKNTLDKKKMNYTDIFEIRDNEIEHYYFDPCWMLQK